MKKLFTTLLALAGMAGLYSCSDKDVLETGTGNEVTVSLTAQLPSGIETRSFSDGTKATELWYAVYETGSKTPVIESKGTVTFNELKATVKLQLINGKTYDVLFWAQVPGSTAYTVDFATQTVSMNYDNAVANEETRDAFFQSETFTVEGNMNKEIKLYRPFAQINVGTDDLEADIVTKHTSVSAAMKVHDVYTSFNLLTGKVDEATLTDVTFNKVDVSTISTAEEFPYGNTYKYLEMGYVLVPVDKQNCDVDLMFYYDSDTDPKNTIKVSNAPLQRNYQTNIYGSLLTSNVLYNVTIVPGYEVQHNYMIWDGTSLQQPTTVTKNIDGVSTTVYQVSNGAELAYMAKTKGLEAAYIELTADIDLDNNVWTPFGSVSRKNGSQFSGTIDGNGYTVKNFTVTADGEDNCAAFIATANGATIKNLTIEGAIVSAYDTAAGLVGLLKGEGSKISGCKVTVDLTTIYRNPGSKAIGQAYGGLVARVYDKNITIEDCEVHGTITCNSDVNAQSKVGGVVGLLASNHAADGLTVKKCKNYAEIKGTSDFGMGGIVGMVQLNNDVKIENCENNGNITNEYRGTNPLNGAGGIIGVAQSVNFAASGGDIVTVTNCTNSGDITAYHVAGAFVGGTVNASFNTSTCTNTGTITTLD